MDKLKYIKIKQEDGTYSEEVPVGVDASNVDMSDGRTLPETLGLIDVDANGTVKQQLDELNKNKVDKDNYNKKINELEKDLKETNETLTEEVNKKVNQLDYNNKISDLEVINKRQDTQINQMIANPGDATEGNSELLDIRIGYNGVKYITAGESVRDQISVLHNFLKNKTFSERTETLKNYTDLNDMIINGSYLLNSLLYNAPPKGEQRDLTGSLQVFNWNYKNIYGCTQFVFLQTTNEIFFRIKWANSWNEWIKMGDDANFNNNLNTFKQKLEI